MSRRDLRGFGRDDERNTASAAESRTLDESARQEIERLPEVLEAYPDIRFITELRYQDKPHLTMVSGIPAFGAIERRFFRNSGQFFLLRKRARSHSAKIVCRGIARQRRPSPGRKMTSR